VLDWIGRADAGAAGTLHTADQPKPYTISPLWRHPAPADGGFFEVSATVDWLVGMLEEGVRRSDPEIRLGAQQFSLTGQERLQMTDWAAFLTPPASGLREMTIRLLTPTAHHGPNRKPVVVPSPELYFGSWLNRWNLSAPAAFDSALLNTVEHHVAVAHCDGRTRHTPLPQYGLFTGFVGTVQFALHRHEAVSADERTALAALARLSSFCGTGVQTMRGMGQTVGLEVNSE
jgi:CRISPR-associated endoribonuclease Cas6